MDRSWLSSWYTTVELSLCYLPFTFLLWQVQTTKIRSSWFGKTRLAILPRELTPQTTQPPWSQERTMLWFQGHTKKAQLKQKRALNLESEDLKFRLQLCQLLALWIWTSHFYKSQWPSSEFGPFKMVPGPQHILREFLFFYYTSLSWKQQLFGWTKITLPSSCFLLNYKTKSFNFNAWI